MSGRRGERGAAAIMVAVAVACAAALTAQAARLGAHAVARARAQTAADAAALAAADALALGKGAIVARAVAEQTAAANGAHLEAEDCDCTGRLVRVRVAVRFAPLAGMVAEAHAEAAAEIRPVIGPS